MLMKKIKEYTIEYGDYRLKFLNIGAAIIEYSICNKNIVLAYENLESYKSNNICLGTIVGRTAGRIRGGKIPGWQLPLNENGKNNIHGNGLHHAYYDVMVYDNKAILTLHDKEGIFPGNADIKVTYTLTVEGLIQTIECLADTPTVFNMTNHSYFNLGHETILTHNLEINANKCLGLDEDNIPIHTIDVKDTLFDFNKKKLISDAKDMDHPQLAITKFLNHPYKLEGNIVLETNELMLEIITDEKFAVIYTGNHISDCQSRINNGLNHDYSGICIETQDAPGTTNLVDNYKTTTLFKLSKK